MSRRNRRPGNNSHSMLERISAPADLKSVSHREQVALCEELRKVIVQVVLRNGGHLAPNLGTVELTVALLASFDVPPDKIVWDVGHQSYVYKLLTGRKGRFHTLRQMGGLSGFPSRAESEYDIFGTGHGSTSVSAALGLATARDAAGGEEHVVAVIGDGAMTGGMAFEALNNTGHAGRRLIVVLNDNQMSISSSVGAMAHYLDRLRTDPHYLRMKRDLEQIMSRLPLGTRMWEAVERFKESIRHVLTPGALFEELGFAYFGPIDGHNIREMRRMFNAVKTLDRPVVVHVTTQKGRGYQPAEDDATRFHGIAGDNGAVISDRLTYTEVFGQTMVDLGDLEPRLVAVTAAMAHGTGLTEFARKFPHRFWDVGMAEQHAVTFCAGMAAGGLKPVAAIYSTFLQRAYDQISHDVCLQRLPVVFAIDRGGIVGGDGPTHQGLFDLSYLRHIPNLVIMSPADEDELRQMLYTALKLDAPCAIRYPRAVGPGVRPRKEFAPIPLGKAVTLREGTDLCLLAVGSAVTTCLAAARLLESEGVRPTVVNARFVKPLDEVTIAEIAETHGVLVTVEENVATGGFGSAVLEALHRLGRSHLPVRRIALPDRFLPHGEPGELRQAVGLDASGVANAALSLIKDAYVRVGS